MIAPNARRICNYDVTYSQLQSTSRTNTWEEKYRYAPTSMYLSHLKQLMIQQVLFVPSSSEVTLPLWAFVRRKFFSRCEMHAAGFELLRDLIIECGKRKTMTVAYCSTFIAGRIIALRCISVNDLLWNERKWCKYLAIKQNRSRSIDRSLSIMAQRLSRCLHSEELIAKKSIH